MYRKRHRKKSPEPQGMLRIVLICVAFLVIEHARARTVVAHRKTQLIEFPHENTNTQTITFPPDVASPESSWITLDDAYSTTNSIDCINIDTAAVCIGVFVGSVDMSGLFGCLGSAEACLMSNSPILFGCVDYLRTYDSLQTRHNGFGAEIAEADDLHIVHYTPLSDSTVSTCIAFNSLEITTNVPCPLFDMSPVMREHSDDPITTLSLSRSAFTTDQNVETTVYFGATKVVTTPKTMWKITNTDPALQRWPTVHAITPVTDTAVCATSYDFYREKPLFRANVDAHMHAPAKYLILTYPTLQPTVPGMDITVILSVYMGPHPIDTVYVMSRDDMRMLRVGNCMSDHRLQITYLTHTGNILHNSSIVFSPKQMCAVEGLALDCFCEKDCAADPDDESDTGDTNKDGLYGMDDPDCAISAATSTAPPSPTSIGNVTATSLVMFPVGRDDADFDAVVTSTIEFEHGAQNVETHTCIAVDITNGETYRGTTLVADIGTKTVLNCTLLLPSSIYTIYHAPLLSSYTSRGIVGGAGIVQANVVVCSVGIPFVSGVLDGNGDTFAYLQVNTGVQCPGTSTVVPTPMRVTWYRLTLAKTRVLVQEDESHVMWFPDQGRYVAVLDWRTASESVPYSQTSGEYLVVENSAYPPRMCNGVEAALTFTGMPRFDGDHESKAYLHVNYTVPDTTNPSLRRVWSVQVTVDGSKLGWYEYDRTEANTPPRSYPFPLDTDVEYSVQVMLLVESPSATNVFMDSACYVNAGSIPAVPRAHAVVFNPVHIITCPNALIIFTVASNTRLPLPTSGYVIDLLEEKEGTMYKYTYAAGPYNAADDDSDMLVLRYNFGVSGRLILTDLRDNIVNGYAQQGSLSVDIQNPVVSTPESTDYNCFDNPYDVSVHVNNVSPLPVVMHTQDTQISVPAYYKGYIYQKNIRRPTMASFAPVKISVLLALPHGSTALDVCAPVETEIWVSPYIDTNVTMTFPVPEESDVPYMCKGLVPVKFSIPHFDSSIVRYIAESDQDLTSDFVMPGKTYYVTASRDMPIVLSVYHNFGSTLQTWKKTSCSIQFLPSMFSSAWLPNSSDIKNIVKTSPTCVGVAGSQIGSAMVVVTRHTLLTVEGANGEMFYNGYPSLPWDGRYFFPQLPLGYYKTTTTLTSVHPVTTQSFECQSNSSFTIGNDIPLETLIDFSQSSVGTKQMKCPASMYGSSAAWREHYILSLQPDFISLNALDTLKMHVWDTSDGTMHNGNLYEDSEGSKGLFTLPMPGKYVAALITNSHLSNHECTYFLPSYTVISPMYTPDDFVLEFVEYPSCTDSSDGLLRLRFPSSVKPEVQITGCEKWSMLGPSNADKSCLGDVHLTLVEDTLGWYFVAKDVPFLAKLNVQIDIMGACRIMREYTLAPSLLMYPQVSQIQIRASCNNMYVFEPVFRDPYNADAEAYNILDTGPTRFEWVIDNTKQKTPTPTLKLKTLTEGMTIGVTIYNEQSTCRFSASRTIDAADIVPLVDVRIDPIVVHEGRRSLPIFCPRASDAFLYAALTPPAHDNAHVTWTTGDGDAIQTVVNRPDASMAHSLGAGTYRVVYNYTHKDTNQTCVASDTIMIPEKTQYNVLAHIEVDPAECNGGTASARLNTGDGCLLEPEFTRFFVTMVSSENRKYLNDNGHGSDTISGVPNGHTIDVRMQYPDKYKYRPASQCETDMRIAFAKAAPIPVFVGTPDIHEFTGLVAVSLHVPYWYGDVHIEWQETQETGPLSLLPASHKTVLLADPMAQHTFSAFVTDTTTGCAQESSITIDPQSTVLRVVAVPSEQTMQSAYYAVDPVQIHIINSVTGKSALLTNIVPSKFPLLHHTHNANGTATTYTYTLPAGTAVHMQGYALSTTFTIYNAAPNKTLDTDAADLLDCPQVQNTDFTVTEVSFSVFRVTHPLYTGWALNNIEIGVHHVQIPDVTCPIDQWLVFPPNSEVDIQNPPLTIVQTTGPTCTDSNGGMAVATLSPEHTWPVSFHSADPSGVSDVPMNPKGNRIVVSGLASGGTYWLKTQGENSPHHVFVVPIQIPVVQKAVLLVQPRGLPPPEPLTKSTVIAIRPRATHTVDVDVYVRHATVQTNVFIWSDSLHATKTGHEQGQPPEHECLLTPTGLHSWPYLCTYTLNPGKHYTLATECQGNIAPASLSVSIAYQTPHVITCSIAALPASLSTSDGSISVTVKAGVGPFVYVWSPSYGSEVSPLRTVTLDRLKAGRISVSVYDMNNYMLAAEGSRTCELTLAPRNTFVIQTVKLLSVVGCDKSTRGVIAVRTSSGIYPSAIGAWNNDDDEPAIQTCSDPRMRTPTPTEVPHVVTITVPPGTWNVAICEQATLALPPLPTPVKVEVHHQAMQIRVQNGEFCEQYQRNSTSRRITKEPPMLYVEGADAPLHVEINKEQIEVRTTVVDGVMQVHLSPDKVLPPGMYVAEVQDARKCPMTVAFTNKDTGVAPCGTCDVADTSCFGCDGVAFSGAVSDSCGVCKGSNECFADCTISDASASHDMQVNSAEIVECNSRGQIVHVPNEASCVVNDPTLDVMLEGVDTAIGTLATINKLEVVVSTLILQRVSLQRDIYVTANTMLIKDSELSATIHFVGAQCAQTPTISIEDSHVRRGTRIVAMTCMRPGKHATPVQTTLSTNRRRRAIDADYGEEQEEDIESTELATNGTDIDIFGSDVDGLSVAGNNVGVTTDNSSVTEITLVSGSSVKIVQSNSTIMSIDITEYRIPGASAVETTCILFRDIPTLETVKNNKRTYTRRSYDCSPYDYKNIGDDVNSKTWVAMGAGTALVFAAFLIYALAFRVLQTKTPLSTRPIDYRYT